jgi:hypothetical protein
MSVRQLRLSLVICAFSALSAVSLGASAGADVRAARRDAEAMKQKVAAINQFAERPGKQPRRTMITESEVNAYLAYEARQQLPVGVVDPSVTILGTGRLSGRATVDLDAVRTQRKATGLLDPMTYLTGRLPIAASGVLTTRDGVGRFELESAELSGVPIPKMLLQEILSYYSRTPEKPGGIALDDPFALPARIREIHVQRGQAVVVQ